MGHNHNSQRCRCLPVRKFDKERQEFIRNYLIRLMSESDNLVCVACKKAGVHRSWLYRMLKMYAPDLKTEKNEKQRVESFKMTWENKVGNAEWRELG